VGLTEKVVDWVGDGHGKTKASFDSFLDDDEIGW